MKQGIHIGTSGWSYQHWKGPFYPSDLHDDQMLAYYVQHFNNVEINTSFYHLPREETLLHWQQSTPADFLFSAKASRYITHMKKLKDPEDSVSTFIERISRLGNKLGPILFQLPPNWHFNAERLEVFLHTLNRKFRYAFEFRDHSWLNETCFDLLSRHDAALCIYELDGFISPKTITSDFVYVRLHGPAGAYQGNYDTRTLKCWAREISDWSSQDKDVFCYFDNDQLGYAAHNAQQLQTMLDSD